MSSVGKFLRPKRVFSRMTQRNWTIVGVSALAVVAVLLGLRVAFDDKFDDFERYVDAREHADDPEEFDRNFAAMAAWLEQYKRENPGATDEDAAAAYEAGIRAMAR